MLLIVIASAQGDVNAVRDRVQQRFQILPLADGVVLTPRFKSAVRSIEVSDTAIAVDGSPVSSGELRERLGTDADLVLRVSYLDAASRRALAGIQQAPSVKPADPTAPTLDPRSATNTETQRLRRRDDVVRIGGSVTIDADETVEGDVVVIGGSATVNGEVDGELVVVGGSAKLGPQADIHRDVTVVGGPLSRDPTAVIRGKVQEVGFGDVPWEGGWPWNREGRWSRGTWGWNPMSGLYPLARFMGTLLRVGLLVLLAALVMFVARTPVEQIADRAAAEPIKSWAVGFLAEILFVPLLVLTAVVLAISIIGIPLLLLIPVAIVAAMVVFLVGFTGVAYHIGRLLQGRVEELRTRPYAATFLGIAVILSPLLLARLIGFIGGLGFVAGSLVAIGIVVEYIAWTTGLGAAALARFSRPSPSTAVSLPPST
jgi:nitrate reductase NapE component